MRSSEVLNEEIERIVWFVYNQLLEEFLKQLEYLMFLDVLGNSRFCFHSLFSVAPLFYRVKTKNRSSHPILLLMRDVVANSIHLILQFSTINHSIYLSHGQLNQSS